MPEKSAGLQEREREREERGDSRTQRRTRGRCPNGVACSDIANIDFMEYFYCNHRNGIYIFSGANHVPRPSLRAFAPSGSIVRSCVFFFPTCRRAFNVKCAAACFLFVCHKVCIGVIVYSRESPMKHACRPIPESQVFLAWSHDAPRIICRCC